VIIGSNPLNMYMLLFAGCLIWAKAFPVACFLDLVDWYVDWHFTRVVALDLET